MATAPKARINEEIDVPRVRLIDDAGGQLGVVDTYIALQTAQSRGLDLVEVSPGAMPPVCKLMDFGKFQYQQKKKVKEAKKNQTVISVKEVKFRPGTDDNDFDHKLKNLRRFLSDGDKAKIKVFFRGREMMHPEIGEKVIARVIDAIKDIAKVESPAKMEGRQMIAVVTPTRAPNQPSQPA